MTSQEEMDALKAEAKELKVAGWQLCKDPEKLKQKIADAKAGGTERKKAPKLRVAMTGENSRNRMIEQLEKDDPDCKYLTQSSKLTPSEAETKGIEIVKKDNGEILYCGEDIVCKTDRNSYYEWQNNRTKGALNSMKSIDKDLSTKHGGKRIQAVTERPKEGRDPE